MRMRLKPLRGAKFNLKDGTPIMVIETLSDFNGSGVKVILPDGKMTVVSKEEILLPHIETKEYEKI